MVIAGTPSAVADDPFTNASKVLQAIDVLELRSDILDIPQNARRILLLTTNKLLHLSTTSHLSSILKVGFHLQIGQ